MTDEQKKTEKISRDVFLHRLFIFFVSIVGVALAPMAASLHTQLIDGQRAKEVVKILLTALSDKTTATVVADQDWNVLGGNAKAATYFGVKLVELGEVRFVHLFAHEQHRTGSATIGEASVFAATIHRNDGTTIDVKVSHQTLTISGTHLRIAYIRDKGQEDASVPQVAVRQEPAETNKQADKDKKK